MRLFLRNLLIFTVALVAVFTVADFLYSFAVRRSSGPYSEVWWDVMTGEAKADIVALGDSRVSTDFVPDVVDSLTSSRSYNLGSIGQHFSMQLVHYEMFRKRSGRPRLLLHFVDNWTFAEDFNIEKYFKIEPKMWQYMPWMWAKDFRRSLFRANPFFFCLASIPWVRYQGLHPATIKFSPRDTDRGYFPEGPEYFTPKWKNEEQYVSNRERVKRLYREFLQEVKDDNVDIVIVIPPFSDEYHFKAGEDQKLYDNCRTISEEFDIPLLDYTGMSMCADTAYFFDEVHLQPSAARVFCDTLVKDIMKLGLLGHE